MSFVLFVGDRFEELSFQAKEYDPAAELLENFSTNDISRLTGTYYTSLADAGDIISFHKVCLAAKKIFYRPPARWSNEKQQHWTEITLWYANQFLPVDGLKFNSFESLLLNLTPLERIEKNKPQIWTAGCSITAGLGVEKKESWPFLLSKEMGIPYTNLAESGSSIIWSANKICRAPLEKGDLVFWGLTSHNRLDVIDNDKIIHLIPRVFEENPEYKQKFPIEMLDSFTLFYHNVMAIVSANNFCQAVGAKLIILGLLYDWDSLYKVYKLKNFRQSLCWPDKYIDLGSDGLHPGPNQHVKFANEFLNFYNDIK